MGSISDHLVQHAQQTAQEIGARALVLCADVACRDGELDWLSQIDLPVILVTRSTEVAVQQTLPSQTWVTVPAVRMSRPGQVKTALLVCLARGVLRRGDRVVCLTGVDGSCSLDTLVVLDLGVDAELFPMLDPVVVPKDVRPEIFEQALTLLTQLARQGGRAAPWEL